MKQYTKDGLEALISKDSTEYYNIYSNDQKVGYLHKNIIEKSWLELIPEVNPMEVVEGYSVTAIEDKMKGYNFTDRKLLSSDEPTILIKNPTPEMKAIIKAVDKKQYETRWLFDEVVSRRSFTGQEFHDVKSANRMTKILIIPIESEGE